MRGSPRRGIIGVVGLIAVLTASAGAAQAQDLDDPKGAMAAAAPVSLDKYGLLKRLSLDLRDAPPVWEEIQALEGEADVPDAVIDAWLDSDGFLDVMVGYHRDLLWANVSNFQYIQFPWDLSRVTVGPSGDQHVVYHQRRKGAYYRGGPGAQENQLIPCGQWEDAPDAMGNPTDIRCEPDGTCREGWVWVEPYWAPEQPIKVCAYDAQERRVGAGGVECSGRASRTEPSCGCGPGLAFCDWAGDGLNVQTEVGLAFSEQTLQVVRWVIAEDRPYPEILTTRMSFVNGPIVHYYKNQIALASNIDLEPAPVETVFLPDIPYTDKAWYPILQGEEHSGILTSYGFLLRFQTNRSRVNRFYNAFLDSAFDASKSTGSSNCVDAGADLTKRCYCQNCHVAVEPWAAYWARWKQQGGGYLDQGGFPIYDDGCAQCARTGVGSCPTRCRNEYVIETVPADREPYLGYLRGYEFLKPEHMLNTEAGPRLWVERTLQDGSLGRGVVSRMWKHFMQRELEDTKADNEVKEQLFATFVASNYNIKALVKAIVTHPAYRRNPMKTQRSSSLRSCALLAVVGALVACGAEASDPPAPVAGPAEGAGGPAAELAPVDPVGALAPPRDYEAIHGDRDFAADVELTPDPAATSRPLRRMSVKQLRDAIANATGGLIWHDEQGRDVLELLAPTLGVPNYVDTTNEDLDASLVFQKFLGDGVRSVCDEAIANDLEFAAHERVLIRGVEPTLTWEVADGPGREAIDANLRYMKLRITGHYLAPGDEEGISRLRWLFRSVSHATGDASRGWRAVCVGLMSSPEFYLY